MLIAEESALAQPSGRAFDSPVECDWFEATLFGDGSGSANMTVAKAVISAATNDIVPSIFQMSNLAPEPSIWVLSSSGVMEYVATR